MIKNNLIFITVFFSIVISSFCLIVSPHTIFCVVFLALSFISSTFVLFLLECEFLGLLFVVIYLGAILILFLFATMLLEFKLSNLLNQKERSFLVGASFAVVFPIFFTFSANINYSFCELNSNCFYINAYQNWYHLTDCSKDVQVYGQVLYSYYVLQFLISGLILMSVLISVVYLTNNYSTNPATGQYIFKQLSRSFLLFKNN